MLDLTSMLLLYIISIYLNKHDVCIVGALIVEWMGEQPVGFSILLSALKGIHNVVSCHNHHMLCPKRQSIPILLYIS